MPRKIRVVTVCMNRQFGKTLKEGLEIGLRLLDQALAQKPDIVCLPENFASAGCSLDLHEKCESVPGPTTDAIARRAKEHRTYVVCPMLSSRGEQFYNSAVIIDRGGEIAGIYDKVQPVSTQWDLAVVEGGVTPGTESRVFELDFGKIGIQICFDAEFPETWKQLEDGGAELVFWPSAYEGGFPLRCYAWLHSYYVVSSVRTSSARIINPLGEVLEQTGRRIPVIARTIDMDYRVCHCDFHWGIWDELVRIHGTDVTVRMQNEEGQFLVESNNPDLPLSKIAEDFGLAPRLHQRAPPDVSGTA